MIGRGHCVGCSISWRWTIYTEAYFQSLALATEYVCPICGQRLRKPSKTKPNGRDVLPLGWKRRVAQLNDRGLKIRA